MVVKTTTKSGLDSKGVHGSVEGGYGLFGTPSAAITLGMGNDEFGNFLALDGMRRGRFLDAPEFVPLHGIGNNENFFDRIDYVPSQANSFHLNLGLQRSWFQIPNQYDQEAAGQDQRQQLRSFNIAPVLGAPVQPDHFAHHERVHAAGPGELLPERRHLRRPSSDGW